MRQVFYQVSISKIAFANNFGNCFEPGLKDTNPGKGCKHINLSSKNILMKVKSRYCGKYCKSYHSIVIGS